jgi:hypothetical protein
LTIRDMLRSLHRAWGVAQRHAKALTTPLLRRVLDTCGDRLIDLRNWALLLPPGRLREVSRRFG